MFPQGYPNYKTVYRRFQHWCRNEVLREVMTDLANTLREEGALDESHTFQVRDRHCTIEILCEVPLQSERMRKLIFH